MESLGIALLPEAFSSYEIVKYGPKAERSGFHSIWIPEHYFFRDSFTILGALSTLTKEIKLATGVVNLFTRHPALIAMSFASLCELSKGRVIAGVGIGVSSWLQKMGFKTSPGLVKRVKDRVSVLRKLLKNERVTCVSQGLVLDNIKLDFKVPNTIPIYLAAVNTKMLEISGEVADGVLLSAGCSPKYVIMARKNVEESLCKSGRNVSEFDFAALVLVSISHDSRKAQKSVRLMLASLLSRPGRAKLMLNEEQINSPEFRKFEEIVAEGNIKKASVHLTSDIVDSLSASGTLHQCMNKIEEYKKAGVDLPILLPINKLSLKYLLTNKLK